MPLPATSSSASLSAFDFVGGDCFAGPDAGQPPTELARSNGAIDSFDDLLQDELDGTKGLAFAGFNSTAAPIPATVAVPAELEQPGAVDAGLGNSNPAAAAANDGVTNLRRLVLGGLRPPVSNGSEAALTPAGEPAHLSSVTSAELATSASTDATAAGDITIPGIERPNTSSTVPSTTDERVADSSNEAGISESKRAVQAETLPAPAISAATSATDEPVILSLDEHRRQTANSVADGKSPTRRDSHLLDETARSQLLPFAPIIGGSAPSTAATATPASANGSPSVASRIDGIGEQRPSSQIDTATPALPESAPRDETADESSAAEGAIASAADLSPDATLVPGDVSPVPVEAAVVSGAVATAGTSPAAREDSTTPRIGGPTGEIDRRAVGMRTHSARSADASSLTASEMIETEQAIAAVRSSRSRPDVVTAVQHADDADAGDDAGTTAQVSASSGSGDATPQAEPTPTEPSVVQQISQAVETWRGALEEQGSARFAAWLSPPDLGHVRVELTRSGEGITARLKASDDSVQSLLESQEPELRQALNDSGISVAELDLSGRPAGDFASDHRQQQPDHHDAETSAVAFTNPSRRSNSSQRVSAIDVRA